jgi:hypothetical protein
MIGDIVCGHFSEKHDNAVLSTTSQVLVSWGRDALVAQVRDSVVRTCGVWAPRLHRVRCHMSFCIASTPDSR